MKTPLTLGKFSFGMGDRFAHQATAQLQAIVMVADRGVEVTPVWNKSNREHSTIGSQPASVRAAAEKAVEQLHWEKPWHVDADHIRLETVDAFLDCSDFFTIDVADSIGRPASSETLRAFVDHHPELSANLEIPGVGRSFAMNRAEVLGVAEKYLRAVQEAGKIFRHIEKFKGAGDFIAEVSMDETDSAQTPSELLIILAAMADENIRVQTIAPKFTGRFNKGVDYVGDLHQFEREFSQDLAVINYAVNKYGLPANLKLSVHSGSDKFSIYQPIRRCLAKSDAGLHLKTAGTTWLEELIGLAESGGEGLALAKEIYLEAFQHRADLCAPYASVIDIDPAQLPGADQIARWNSEKYVAALRHDPRSPDFNPHFRQLLHVGYKIAAQQGNRYLRMLDTCAESVGRNVTQNLYQRHLKPLFLD